jgi:DNA-directed RNA polymerase subunit N (RpoN/RPB10)
MTFILCPECRNCLGDVYTFYTITRKAIINQYIKNEEKYSKYSAEQLDISVNAPPMNLLLDMCGLKLSCCRQRVMSYEDIDKR